MRQMTQKEGLLSLYKGILPPVLVETPKRAVKFLTFEQYKQFFMFGSDKATPIVWKKNTSIIFQSSTLLVIFIFQTFSLAGLGAGVTEAILVNPFEMVKVTLQANRSK
jgi:solute carrier family 25 (mitochondrial 2-oxodicarboxylate transporter), member 21